MILTILILAIVPTIVLSIVLAVRPNKKPFRCGNVVSNGEKRMIVNSVFFHMGEWKMLIDTNWWGLKKNIAHFCEEVYCSDWYKIM